MKKTITNYGYPLSLWSKFLASPEIHWWYRENRSKRIQTYSNSQILEPFLSKSISPNVSQWASYWFKKLSHPISAISESRAMNASFFHKKSLRSLPTPMGSLLGSVCFKRFLKALHIGTVSTFTKHIWPQLCRIFRNFIFAHFEPTIFSPVFSPGPRPPMPIKPKATMVAITDASSDQVST